MDVLQSGKPMGETSTITEILILLSAAIFVVTLFLRLKISSVLGYFAAGTLIGVHGLGLVSSTATIDLLAELGIVFLLFLIGLELTLTRLMAMRKYIFGVGSLQVSLTAGLIILLCHYYGLGLYPSLVIGCALAFSSTAIVMQVVQETGIQFTQAGRITVGSLLMQDFAVVPVLVLVQLLNAELATNLLLSIGNALLKAALALVAIFVVGRLFLRPFFSLIASTNSKELFVATTLLIVLGSAYITEHLGLSMAMGAFLAGLLVAETEYQQEVEHVVLPFKGLLLGLFFMTVGMSIDLQALYTHWFIILLSSLGLIIIKSSIILVVGVLFKLKLSSTIHAGLLLAQASEFSLILFGLEASKKILGPTAPNILMAISTTTMALTPLLAYLGLVLSQFFERRFLEREEKGEVSEHKKPEIVDAYQHVILAGFGRVGRMVAQMLTVGKIHYIAIDINSKVVEWGQEEGFPVYLGDITKIETLQAMALERAKNVVLSINNEQILQKAIRLIHSKFPEVHITVRVPDLSDEETYIDLGASQLIPETYETGLQIGGAVLAAEGITDFAISNLKAQFRAVNYAMIKDIEEEEIEKSPS